MQEIIAIPRVELFGHKNYFNGFINRGLFELTNPRHEFIARHMVFDREPIEKRPDYKQIIPYVVIVNSDTGAIASYTRTKGGGEARLHSKRSIGVGGHLEPHDISIDLYETILRGAVREVTEELTLPIASGEVMERIHCIGFINEDISEVGRVHLGVAYVLLFSSDSASQITIKELDQHKCLSWINPEDMTKADKIGPYICMDEFELWSQLIMPVFYPPIRA